MVRVDRDYPIVTVHMDWYRNYRNQRVLAIEDYASQFVFDMIKTDSQSTARSVSVLQYGRAQYETDVPILKVITDHGTEFGVPSNASLLTPVPGICNWLEVTLLPSKSGVRSRSHCCTILEHWPRTPSPLGRPHMSLHWDDLKTPAEACDRLLPPPKDDVEEVITDGGDRR